MIWPTFLIVSWLLLLFVDVDGRAASVAERRHRRVAAAAAGRLAFDGEPALTFAACYGNLTEARRLLDAGDDPNARDWLWQTPLHLAAKFGRMDVVRLLVSRGSLVNARNKDYEETPLHLAAKIGHIEMMNFLLANGANIESPISKSTNPGGTPLLYAISYANSVDAVNFLLSRGAKVNVTNSYPQSALHLAVEHQNIYLVHLLVSKFKIDKEIKDEYGNSALNWAVKLFAPPQAAMARVLVEGGANIESTDNYGRSPLHNAVIYGQVEIAAYLIENGADVDQRDTYGSTPLHSAITVGQGRTGSVVRLLLRNGADASATDKEGCDAPLLALVHTHQIRRRANSETEFIARQLLLFGANPATVDTCIQQSPIVFASRIHLAGLTEMFTFKRQNSSSSRVETEAVNHVDSLKSRTMIPDLVIAAALGDLATVVSALVRNGTFVDTRDYRGQTALHMAALNGHVSVAMALLRRGASVNVVDSDGKTPLHAAASGGHAPMVTLLISHGASPSAVAHNGGAPIHFSIDFRNSSAVVDALLSQGASVTQLLMPDKMSPLHLAAVNQNFDFMKTLLDYGADIEATNVNGATPLNHLVMSNCCYPQLPIVGFLLDHGADIEAQNNNGLTPLHMAIATRKRFQVVEYLLFRGADPNALDANGCNAPLFLLVVNAATTGDSKLVTTSGVENIADLLIRYGANFALEDACTKQTAIDVALDTNQPAVVAILRRAAAARYRKRLETIGTTRTKTISTIVITRQSHPSTRPNNRHS